MTDAAPLQTRLQTALGSQAFAWREKPVCPKVSTGVPQLDSACGGLPQGAITEITGPASSGRTTLLHSILRAATGRGEFCALIDPSDAFDPATAATAGIHLPHLLWVRCRTQKDHALTVTDLLLQNGGWGVVILDLADIESRRTQRIPLHTWYRFRLAVENKPTVFLLLGQEPLAGSCSALILETGKRNARWDGPLLTGATFHACPRKPPARGAVAFQAAALQLEWTTHEEPRYEEVTCLPVWS